MKYQAIVKNNRLLAVRSEADLQARPWSALEKQYAVTFALSDFDKKTDQCTLGKTLVSFDEIVELHNLGIDDDEIESDEAFIQKRIELETSKKAKRIEMAKLMVSIEKAKVE